MPSVSAGHFVLGTEGLALLRSWRSGDEGGLAQRVEEITRFGGAPDASPMSIRFEVPELEVRAG